MSTHVSHEDTADDAAVRIVGTLPLLPRLQEDDGGSEAERRRGQGYMGAAPLG